MSAKTTIDRDSYEPAYAQLVNIIRRQIASGVFQPGSRLPSEAQLCKQYEVSPMTVRRTVNLLVEQDVVSTAQGKGTFVKPLELGAFSFHLQELQELFRDRERTKVTLREVRIVNADDTVSEKLDLPATEKVIYISRLLTRDQAPLLYHQQYLIYDPCRPIVEAEMDVTSLGGLFTGSGDTSFKKGLLSIDVAALEAHEAACLRTDAGAPAFRLEHTFYDFDDRPASWGWLTFPGGSLSFSARVGIWEER